MDVTSDLVRRVKGRSWGRWEGSFNLHGVRWERSCLGGDLVYVGYVKLGAILNGRGGEPIRSLK